MSGPVFTDEGVRRLRCCLAHIEAMADERRGYGPSADAPVQRTRASLLRALGTLLGAHEVWAENVDPDLSLGGEMPGGVVFGMVARPVEPTPAPVMFVHPEIEWTFHS